MQRRPVSVQEPVAWRVYGSPIDLHSLSVPDIFGDRSDRLMDGLVGPRRVIHVDQRGGRARSRQRLSLLANHGRHGLELV